MDEQIISNILKKQIEQEEIYIKKYINLLNNIYKESDLKKKDKIRKQADKYIDELTVIKQEKQNIKEMMKSINSINLNVKSKIEEDKSIR